MTPAAAVKQYLARVADTHRGGNAREHSYRTHLETLLCALLPSVRVTQESAAAPGIGTPDFTVSHTLHGASHCIGCIETKNIGDQDLKGAGPNQHQFNRYKTGHHFAVFTDYLRFLFYQKTQLQDDIAIARLSPQGDIVPLPQNHPAFIARLETTFIGQEFQIIAADDLVAAMADRARLLRDAIAAALQHPGAPAGRVFTNYLKVFQKYLLKTLAPAQFADMAAQTIAYGFLIARAKSAPHAPFTRQTACERIPESIHFLRGFFNHIAGAGTDPSIRWIVDSMADIFAIADVEKILYQHGQQSGAQDPVFHFYESFLAKYDPDKRAERGVWYTPQAAINFIVRAVDDLLQTQFAMPQGLATRDAAADPAQNQTRPFHKVQILDPAAGTGSFLSQVIRRIHAKVQQGGWSHYVENHLLPRVNGFEILMVPYAIAHLRLADELAALGYAPSQHPQPRCQLYLTDALERLDMDEPLLMEEWLVRETEEANIVKNDAPVMCVIGNPPYLAASANNGDWIMQRLQSYKTEPGGKTPLQERNPKWLNDDYVKFIRYSQHFIEKGGRGIVAFINPHGYLDNRTFRGMRWQLLHTYDRIYVIDLHGNARKQETAPDGGKDDNVFNIMQGVCINIFVKTGEKPDGALAQVFHHDLYGERDHKYQYLMDHSLDTVPFQTLAPQGPQFYMVPRNYELASEYNQGIPLTDIFPVNGVGVTTAHDKFVISNDKDELLRRFAKFQSSRRDAEFLHQEFAVKEKKGWDILDGYDNIKDVAELSEFIRPIAYRPFDTQWIFYEDKLVWRTVRHVMQHFMLGDNLGLVTFKQLKAANVDNPQFIVDNIMEGHLMSDINYVFPLYLYTANNAQGELPAPAHDRTPNLNMTIVAEIAERVGLQFSDKESDQTITPENILDYAYAALHSPAYRRKYAQFLKTDFPRIPMPANKSEFRRLASIGQQLRQTHLLQHPATHKTDVTYPADGSHHVTAVKYQNGKVYINQTQHFANVPAAAWTRRIGGYQPAQKYLKDRKNQTLTYDDIERYPRLIAALLHAITLTNTIDP